MKGNDKPPEKQVEKEKPARPPLTRAGILDYISKTGVEIHLIKDALNRKIDPIDPAINPHVTYEEQISFIENEVILWATEEVAMVKEEMAEKVIEEIKSGTKRERAKRRKQVLKEYGDVVDIIVEEALRRVITILPELVQKYPETYPSEKKVYPESPYYYRSYEEVYESLDTHRKRMLKDIFKELLR